MTNDKVWIKPTGELPFLYGNHVAKAHLGRITEDTPEHQGVVVYNMADVPLVRYSFIPACTKSRYDNSLSRLLVVHWLPLRP